MASGSAFTVLTPVRMAQEIRTATRAIAFISRELRKEVVDALCEKAQELGQKSVTVITDPSAGGVRDGYTDIDLIVQLRGTGVEVRSSPDIGIGLLCVDNRVYVFTPTSSLLDNPNAEPAAPNAIVLNDREADRVTRDAVPELRPTLSPDLAPPPPNHEPAIGEQPVTEFEIKRTQKDLEERPPVAPDLSRTLRVLNSHFQFVKIEFKGAKLERRRLRLQAKDLGLEGSEIASHIEGTWKLFGEKIRLQTQGMQRRLEAIRRQHLVLVPGFGYVVPIQNRPALESSMNAFEKQLALGRQELLRHVQGGYEQSKERLHDYLLAAYRKSPPPDFQRLRLSPENLDKALAREVDDVVGKKFPALAELLDQMSIDLKIYSISDQIVAKDGFAEAVEKAFRVPLSDLVEEHGAFRAVRADGADSAEN